MNGEPDYEKVMEIDFHGVTYLITIKAYPQSLSIELEDKYSGQIWINEWQPHFIEEITKKTGNYKKYGVFLKMLITAFTKNSQSVYVDILTHHDIQMQNARRNPSFHKTMDPLISQRRYVILSYMVQFDKVHYPLALNYNDEPQTDRLKLTIKRLNEELKQSMGSSKVQNSAKQVSILKHENELLKAKLRSQSRNQSKENQNNENKKYINELEQEKMQFQKSLENKERQMEQIREELAECRELLNTKNILIEELKEEIKKEKSKENTESQELYKVYENEINRISLQVKELASELQHSRENQKKNKLKITNLEKELESMMELKSKSYNKTYNYYDTPRSKKSNNSSLKGSVSGRNIQNQNQKKKVVYPRKKSVQNSQTISSRMRRQNNHRTSPFRQGTSNLSNSGKKSNRGALNGTSRNKYNNISNLNDKKNRSRSKSVKRQRSPPEVTESSALMTEGYQSDSDSEQRNEEIMNQLRNRKTSKLFESKNRLKKKEKNSSALQEKISNIAEMLKKVRRNQ